jgi:uncharacterized repeat protein (TIGR01451 family)
MTRGIARFRALLAATVAASLAIPLAGVGVASAADPPPAFQITISVLSAQATYSFVGEQVNVTITATNAGTDPLSNAYIESIPAVPLTGANCFTSASPKNPFDPAGTFTCQATLTITQADLDEGTIQTQFNAKGSHGVITENATATPNLRALQAPKIELVKSVPTGTNFSKPGDKIPYTLVSTNTGNVTLKNVKISDPLLGGDLTNCTPALGSSLAPLATMTCTAQYTVTQADVDAGKVDNVATTTGTPPKGANVTDTDNNSVPGVRDPKIDLVKTVESGSNFTKPGDKINYKLVSTNTGNQTLTNVKITDPLLGGDLTNCTPAKGSTLAPAASMTCTAQYTVTQADLNAGKVDNTATTTGKPPTGADVTDTDSKSVPGNQTPGIELTKKATSGQNFTAVGQKITYSLVSKNTGNVTLTNVKINDPKLGGDLTNCTPAKGSSLDPGATMTCTGEYTVTQEDLDVGHVDNEANTKGTPPSGPDVTDTDDERVPGQPNPSIVLVKSVTAGTPYRNAGDKISYSLVATNDGNMTLTGVKINDPLLGGDLTNCTPSKGSSLAPGARMTCTADYTVTQADVDRGSVMNTAKATGTPRDRPDVTDEDNKTVPAVSDPKIDLVKTVTSGSPFAKAGDKITYSLVSTNTGNQTLKDVKISDPLLGGDLTNCSPAKGATLAPGGKMTCTGSYTVNQADVDAGKVDNTADTVGTPPSGPNVTDTDSKSVPGGQTAAIDLVKRSEPSTYTVAGQKITYTLVATNTGAVTLSNVVITDPKLGSLTCTPGQPTVLAPNEKLSCTGSYTTTTEDVQTGEVKNTAKVTGQPPGNRPPVTDEDSVIVTGPVADLGITKTHTPTSVEVGDNVTFTLTVRNFGPGTSYGVKVTDTLPSALTYVSATGPDWSCSHASQVVTCTLGSPLPSGASTAITLVATTNSASSQVVNVAIVDSKTKDPNPDNNRAEDVVGVPKAKRVCPADSVTKAGGVVLKGCRNIQIRALCKVSKPSAAGEQSYCRVKVRRNGSVKVVSRSQYPVRVKAIWYSPATGEYVAFRKVRRFTINPNN